MNRSIEQRMSFLEWGVAILATLFAIFLHVTLFRSVGAIWRDETGIVNIAMLPSLGEIWGALFHDHCPLLFPMLIRGWSTVTGGPGDMPLHVLGLGIGLFLLSMLWATTQGVGRGRPMLSLALVGLNPAILFYGDSLRAYGLAGAFSLLALLSIWRFIDVPRWPRGILAGAAVVLAVQTLYPTAFLVLAACAGGIAVGLRRRQRKVAAAVFGIGVVAAVSLVPYVGPIRRSQSWWAVSQSGDTVPNFLDRLFYATVGDRHLWFLCVWFMMLGLALVLGGLFVISRRPGKEDDGERDPVLFAGCALAVSLAGYGLFFGCSKMFPQVWYFIPALTFAAVCCDIILRSLHPAMRPAIVLVALVSMVLMCPSAGTAVRQRRTDIDLVAAQVSRQADARDLVVVCPWHYGITFSRYYHGNAPWTTLPAVGELRFHRYDLVKAMLQTNSAEPVIQRAVETLASGHRVWIVGDFTLPNRNRPIGDPPTLSPIPGQEELTYNSYWCARFAYCVSLESTNDLDVFVPLKECNPLENVKAAVASGWQARPIPSP